MTGSVVISKADRLMYIVLSKAEKHMPCGELVFYHRMYKLGVAQTEDTVSGFSCVCNAGMKSVSN